MRQLATGLIALVFEAMEVVVRTPHGSADVSIRENPESDDAETTVAEVLTHVTGQATPRVARVDGTVVETTALLNDVAADGSTIETDAAMPAAPPGGTRWLVAIAGPGTGRALELEPGRYRIGPGRRMRAEELAMAVVDVPAAEIEVAAAGEARVRPADRSLGAHLANAELDDETSWQLDTPEQPAPPLVVGERAFLLRSEPPTIGRWRGWRRRDADAPLDVPIGIVEAHLDDPSRGGSYGEETLDLRAHPFVAVISTDVDARQAMLRSIALGAAQARRPRELDIAIVTEPAALAAWDWAKWLPHVRVRDSVQVFADDAAIAAWLDDRRATPSDQTLLILDSHRATTSARWPLRSLIADPPDDIIVAVGAASATAAPSATSAEIQLFHGTAAAVVGDSERARLLPGLIDLRVATDIARSLARDGGRERVVDDHESGAGPDLLDLVGGTSTLPWEARIGRDYGGAVSVELGSGVIDIVSTRFGPTADAAAAIVAGACMQHPPEELWVIDATGRSEPSSLDAIRRLPHVVLSGATPSRFDRRVMARIDHLLRAGPHPQRVLIVATDGDDPRESAALAALGDAGDGVVVLSLRQRALTDARTALDDDELEHAAHTRIRIAEQVGRRVATIAVGDHAPNRFAPYEPRRPIRRWPEIAPFTAGRTLTPLERRLQRLDESGSATPPDLARIVQLIGDASTAITPPPVVLPPELPDELDAAKLRSRAPGDGVPIGLIDRPEEADDAVWWWVPGDGSMLFVGAIRSGVRRILRTLADGIAERCSRDDVAVAAVIATASTKRAYAALPHAIDVADRTNPDEIVSLIETLEAAIETPRPQRVIAVIDDVGWTRSTLRSDADRHRLDVVLATACAAGAPIDIVATASTIDEAGPLIGADRRAVGQLGDRDEAFRLALPDELDRTPIAGRCWLLPQGTLGQLAASGALDQRRAAQAPATGDASDRGGDSTIDASST